ncbi:MAG: helix-turn-helix domain-containing protein [Candidatus Thiodiazotropha sp.]|jgi:AraC family ethanolamine operon transcriptional activator
MIAGEMAPKWCAKVSKREAFDADLHAGNLTDWQQEYDQTSRGNFHGSIVELALGDLQVFREQTSQALHQKCIVWPDSIWLGVPQDKQEESRINGLTIRPTDIMCRPGNCEFHLATPQAFDIFGLVAKRDTLMETARIHGLTIDNKELDTYGRLSVPSKILQDIRFLLTRLLSSPGNEVANRMTRDIIMIALLEILKNETPEPARMRSYHHRKRVVDAAREFIRSNPEPPVTITDICQATHVSRRTLQYSFESIVGISPIQYLRISRLNCVRRALLQSEGGEHVTDIASQWGFYHMSQFAKDYGNLFGERPSETLELRTVFAG